MFFIFASHIVQTISTYLAQILQPMLATLNSVIIIIIIIITSCELSF
jgi:uncharacterized membrane protein (DUF106 family)